MESRDSGELAMTGPFNILLCHTSALLFISSTFSAVINEVSHGILKETHLRHVTRQRAD